MKDNDSVYVNFWGKQSPKFTDMERALMEGGHSIINDEPPKFSFIKEIADTMKATEIITERFNYSSYIPKIKTIVTQAYNESQDDEYTTDSQHKINNFLYAVQQGIDQQVMDELVRDHPLVVDGIPVVSLSVSFHPSYKEGPTNVSMGTLSAHSQKKLKSRYPGAEIAEPGAETIAKFIRSHVNFLGQGYFNIDKTAKSAIIDIDVKGLTLLQYLFNVPNASLVEASLDTLTSDIISVVVHEIKHYMQGTKTKTHSQALNRFYTGDPKKMDKERHYKQNKSGYWLNAEEMDAWAANAAGQIINVFGNDTRAMSDYIALVAKGQTLNYNGVPVETVLNVYQRQIFNKRYKLNTDRNVLWRKFLKDVYKDLQMYLTSQPKRPPAKPQ